MITHIHMANLLTCGDKKGQAFWLDEVKNHKATSLETFWKGKEIEKILEVNPDVTIFLDSGAHSLLNAQAGLIGSGDTIKTDKKEPDSITFTPDEFYSRLDHNARIFMAGRGKGMAQEMVDYSFVDSEDVKKYIDNYVKFIHKYKKQLLGYVNLDIIYNAEKSWEVQRAIESNGLRPIPVFHYGEDIKWLEKYVEEYDYIGVGGMATGLGKAEFVEFAKRCFDVIDKKPGIKVHGFAVTSFEMMTRYNWYSCDSTSWLKVAAFGNVVVPRWSDKLNDFDFLTTPFIVTVSELALLQPSDTNIHYTRQFTPTEIERIHIWFDRVGIEMDYLELEGKKISVLSSILKRQKVNVYYFTEFLKQFKKVGIKKQKINKRFF